MNEAQLLTDLRSVLSIARENLEHRINNGEDMRCPDCKNPVCINHHLEKIARHVVIQNIRSTGHISFIVDTPNLDGWTVYCRRIHPEEVKIEDIVSEIITEIIPKYIITIRKPNRKKLKITV